MQQFIAKMKKDSINSKFFLSQASYCGFENGIDYELLNIQDSIIKTFDFIFRGPNTDSLTNSIFRLDDECHFSLLGYDKFSDLWLKYYTNISNY